MSTGLGTRSGEYGLSRLLAVYGHGASLEPGKPDKISPGDDASAPGKDAPSPRSPLESQAKARVSVQGQKPGPPAHLTPG